MLPFETGYSPSDCPPPWLTGAEWSAVTWLRTAEGSAFLAGCSDFFKMLPVLDAEWAVLWREPLLRRAHENPAEPFETNRGGYLPAGARMPKEASQTALDVEYRAQLRANGDYKAADLVRKVIEGGGVEVRDTPTGTFWVFGRGTIWR